MKTDNEIIKALECCAKIDCLSCPFIRDFKSCDRLEESVLDLIEEIERRQRKLKNENR